MIGEETLVLCIVLATMAGLVIGYAWKARTHEKEIDAILRIARRIEVAKEKKERAPKGPLIKFGDGGTYGTGY
jgi:hypothetical protein